MREISVSHDLREREDDILCLRLHQDGRDGWLYVYLLLEFQASVDRLMAVRLLTYIGLLYQDLAAAGQIPAGEHLPPVLPIVLYNGERTWWAQDQPRSTPRAGPAASVAALAARDALSFA